MDETITLKEAAFLLREPRKPKNQRQQLAPEKAPPTRSSTTH
jgi:hypothetical protein